MNEEFQRLRRAAKDQIETDRLLAGDALAPGTKLPPPAPPPAHTPLQAQASTPARPRAATKGPKVPPLELTLGTTQAKQKAAELETLDTSEVRGCTKCGLCKGRSNTVFGEGNPDANVFFVGEGPGEEEDRFGRPFIGRAGELLTKMIAAMGLTREDIYIGNVVKCRPPGNRAPAADEVAACWDHLIGQLKIIQPKVIVSLGNPATHALLNTTVGITRLRGQWQSLPMLDPALAGIKVMPTYHPAYVLRAYTQENRRQVWEDLQKVMEQLRLAKQ